jgi:hypothetical protein
MAPEFFPYLQAGQIRGMLGGMAGAAQYEALLKRADTATKGMDAQSMAHLLIIALIVFGNVLWMSARGDERKRRAARAEGGGAGVALLLVLALPAALLLTLPLAGCGGKPHGSNAARVPAASPAAGASTGAAGSAGAAAEAPNADADTARDGHAFVATYDNGPVDQIRIVRDTSGGIVAAGSTGFPDGTRITVTLQRPRPGAPHEYEAVASTSGQVALGRFVSQPLSLPEGPVPQGLVRVRIRAPFLPGQQSDEVLAATANGRRFKGKGMHEAGEFAVYEVDLEAPL